MGSLLTVLAGPSGKQSTMRAASLFTVVVVIGTWSWVSIRKQSLQPIDPEHAALVLGVLGIKAYQRKTETDNEPKKVALT